MRLTSSGGSDSRREVIRIRLRNRWVRLGLCLVPRCDIAPLSLARREVVAKRDLGNLRCTDEVSLL